MTAERESPIAPVSQRRRSPSIIKAQEPTPEPQYLASQTLTNVVMVPRGEDQQTSIVNNLSCPTFTNRPIESQWIFLNLSHRRYNATQQQADGKSKARSLMC